MMRTFLASALVVIGTGCTTLGPMPAVTGMAPIPPTRAEVQVQVAALPGYNLSAGTTEKPIGAVIPQILALVDPGLHFLHGLVLAGRAIGDDKKYFEPIIGYRGMFSDELSAGLF